MVDTMDTWCEVCEAYTPARVVSRDAYGGPDELEVMAHDCRPPRDRHHDGMLHHVTEALAISLPAGDWEGAERALDIALSDLDEPQEPQDGHQEDG